MLKLMQIKTDILIAGICLLITGCDQKADHVQNNLPYYNTPDLTPLWISNNSEVNTTINHVIADFSFTDQDGKIIKKESTQGKIHIANFFYTSCSGICPVMNKNFAALQDTFLHDDNIVLLSFSVTPESDSVEQLKAYAKRQRVISSKWHLLTGDKKLIYDLARKSYFAEDAAGYSKDTSEFLHTEHFVLVDRHGYIRGMYNGTLQLELQRLIADIRLLESDK